MKISHEIKKIDDLIKIRDKIHLNPSWQRGPVWPTSKQALLIDSILRGYDIPMIYLRECTPEVTYKYEVVDGQQRLRSLWNFIDGKYTLPDNLDKVGNTSISGKKYDDLPKTLRSRMADFRIVIAFVKNAREPEVSLLFSRMQMGVRLNPPELRNAIQSGLRHAVDAVALSHLFFQSSKIPPARFKHQDYLAHAISICMHQAKRDLKAQQLMSDYLYTDSSTYMPLMSDANDILTFLNSINKRTSGQIRQKWIFVDLFYLLYRNKAKLKNLSLRDFTKAYVGFDQRRLEYSAEPERLLSGRPTKEQIDLYDYILAFQISGGNYKNLERRNEVLTHHFRDTLRV